MPAAIDDRPGDRGRDHPFLVVGQHDRGLLVDQGQDPLEEPLGGGGEGGPIAVAVQPQELLLAVREDAGLADRPQARPPVQGQSFHALGVQGLAELRSFDIVAHQPGQCHRGAQAGQRGGDVARPARGVDLARQAHHRHRRLRRDPPHRAVHVPVEHHVADDHHRDIENPVAIRPIIHRCLIRSRTVPGKIHQPTGSSGAAEPAGRPARHLDQCEACPTG